ncbi:hypothetical protein SAMN05216410_2227 [Sanguibacter gelidistatuariae]|uniref:Tetratricopeptide repeat-containing protein n=1 Tax=Sanguibacter gelidistatuariae TaxID=1814289 RepID=A0A1G6NUM4_9MICO|nr:hypothetical protein [Sanguibacter gelidistatuariae]SDC71054.1 hypothetical protein SAMN05216410_2227 [Sanguibacter gelidistatuariae]
MTRSIDEANQAIMRVREMPFGLARNEVAAELAREVGAQGPEGAVAFALFSLVESYAFSEEVEKAYLPFTRSVRLWDERPELFDAQDVHSLFWSFKWMVSNLMSYPSIPAAQIQATIEDMERRYRLAGNGLSAVNHLTFEWHHLLGDAELPARYEEWVTTERDDFSQCPACEPGDRTAYLFEEGRYAEGIRLLENAQEAGEECRTEPADMLSQLQLAYLEVGDADGAARAHRRGLATLDTSGEMCGAHGRHIQFLARTANTTTALRFLVRYQKLLTRTESPQGRWSFLTTAGVGVAALRADDVTTPISLDDVPATTIGELDDWMRDQALSLAADFDRRGGTSAMTDRTLRAWSGSHVRLPVNLTVLGGAGAAAAGPGTQGAAGAPAGGHTSGLQPHVGIGPDALVDQAERMADEDPVTAARLYAQASAAFTAAGENEAGGFALAEAAALSDRLGDLDGAAATADAALSLLFSAGTAIEYIGPVARMAARLLSSTDASSRATDLLTTALEAAESGHALAVTAHDGAGHDRAGREQHAPDDAGRDDAAGRPDGPPPPDAARLAQQVRVVAVERAHLLDTRARVHASNGNGPAAVTDARRAAEAFAAHDLIGDASHAFWLAGTVEQGSGRPADAVWFLESAVEGFAQIRARDNRVEVTGLLIQALTDLGRADEAATLVKGLAG